MKFRSKLCERLLATGNCAFGDRCQYSHTDRPRRNPLKAKYGPTRCECPDSCAAGLECTFAHSRDEELYHPLMYKTSMCPGDPSCQGYYCPFAHHADDLKPAPILNVGSACSGGSTGACWKDGGASSDVGPSTPPRGKTKVSDSVDSSEKHRAADARRNVIGTIDAEVKQESTDESWWYVGDQRDVRVNQRGVVPGHDRCNDGESLIGGTLRPGFFIPKNTVSGGTNQDGEIPCMVKLLPISRGDSQIAATVVKEIKRWIAHCGGSEAAYALRRTVATTVLAVPEWPSTLGASSRLLSSSGSSFAKQAASDWHLTSTLAGWTSQLVSAVQALHSEGIAHLCISPLTVAVDEKGVLRLGDFLGKIRVLRTFDGSSGCRSKPDEAMAIWFPPEVLRASMDSADGSSSMFALGDSQQTEQFRVDAWQLGLTLFYLLTGEHPFGDTQEPSVVCRNLMNDRQVDHRLLEGLPLFADIIGRLLSRSTDQRLLPTKAHRHPVLWPLSDASRFSSSAMQDESASKVSSSLLTEWLRHLPALAPMGKKKPPPADIRIPMQPETLERLCDRAIRSGPLGARFGHAISSEQWLRGGSPQKPQNSPSSPQSPALLATPGNVPVARLDFESPTPRSTQLLLLTIPAPSPSPARPTPPAPEPQAPPGLAKKARSPAAALGLATEMKTAGAPAVLCLPPGLDCAEAAAGQPSTLVAGTAASTTVAPERQDSTQAMSITSRAQFSRSGQQVSATAAPAAEWARAAATAAAAVAASSRSDVAKGHPAPVGDAAARGHIGGGADAAGGVGGTVGPAAAYPPSGFHYGFPHGHSAADLTSGGTAFWGYGEGAGNHHPATLRHFHLGSQAPFDARMAQRTQPPGVLLGYGAAGSDSLGASQPASCWDNEASLYGMHLHAARENPALAASAAAAAASAALYASAHRAGAPFLELPRYLEAGVALDRQRMQLQLACQLQRCNYSPCSNLPQADVFGLHAQQNLHRSPASLAGYPFDGSASVSAAAAAAAAAAWHVQAQAQAQAHAQAIASMCFGGQPSPADASLVAPHMVSTDFQAGGCLSAAASPPWAACPPAAFGAHGPHHTSTAPSSTYSSMTFLDPTSATTLQSDTSKEFAAALAEITAAEASINVGAGTLASSKSVAPTIDAAPAKSGFPFQSSPESEDATSSESLRGRTAAAIAQLTATSEGSSGMKLGSIEDPTSPESGHAAAAIAQLESSESLRGRTATAIAQLTAISEGSSGKKLGSIEAKLDRLLALLDETDDVVGQQHRLTSTVAAAAANAASASTAEGQGGGIGSERPSPNNDSSREIRYLSVDLLSAMEGSEQTASTRRKSDALGQAQIS